MGWITLINKSGGNHARRSIHSLRQLRAPLQIPPTARFVTCRHCSAELEVQRNADVVFTQILQNVSEQILETQSQLDQFKRQQELDRLDAEWQRKRRDDYGSLCPEDPTEMPDFWKSGGWLLLAMILVTMTVIVGIVQGSAELTVPMLSVLLVFGILFGIECSKYHLYQQDLIIYRRRRIKLQSPEPVEAEYEEEDDS